MKNVLRRMTALFLTLATALSLLNTVAWAAELEEPSTLQTEVQEEIFLPAEETMEAEAIEETEVTEETEEVEMTEETAVTEAAEAADPEPVEEQEEKKTKKAKITVLSDDLLLEYDDRYDFNKKYAGYTVTLGSQSPTSYQVEQGKTTGRLDEAVLTLQQDSETKVTATGTGTAEVTLTKGAELINVTVTVTPAKLTLMFLGGQSNMEGSSPSPTTHLPENSILCPEGEVYSTYAPTLENGYQRGVKITGLEDYTLEENDDLRRFVAGSLTGETDILGKSKLIYPLNALTKEGKGKTGPDGALAYEWNRLTKEKVWVVNGALASSYSDFWIPGGTGFQRGSTVFSAALQTAQAEESAGHYTIANRLMFWMQGESDWKKEETSTLKAFLGNFSAMYQGMKELLDFDCLGIITTRAHMDNDTTRGEKNMNNVRTTQYYLALSKEYPDVYMVSNANEQWTSNSGVEKYFQTAYPKGYPTKLLRPETTITELPTTVKEVHPNIHYSQIGHNENGFTAARGMYDVVKHKNTPDSALWRNYDGKKVTSLKAAPGDTATIVLEASPLSAAKNVTIKAAKGLSYSAQNGLLTVKGLGSMKLTASYDGQTLATLSVYSTNLETPALSSVANAAKGVKVTWSKVKGAEGYYIYRKTGSEKEVRVGTSASTTFTDTKAVNGTAYTYTVRAYAGKDISECESGKKAVFVTPSSLSRAQNVKGKKMTLKWAKNAKATGYQVQYGLKSDFSDAKTVTVKKAGSLSKTITGLKKGKIYYVRVRVYCSVSDKNWYSVWSGSKKVKIAK